MREKAIDSEGGRHLRWPWFGVPEVRQAGHHAGEASRPLTQFVRGLLGHKDVATTMIYTHVLNGLARAAGPPRKRYAEPGGCAIALAAVTNFLQKLVNKSGCQASVIPVESSAAERGRHACYAETI